MEETMNGFENLFANAWNRLVASKPHDNGTGLSLGTLIHDGELTSDRYLISDIKRCEHIAILGKTGTGKSSLLRNMAAQDVRRDHGFIYFDHHGDTVPYLLQLIAEEEQRRREDLSAKVILIEPADPQYSVGINVLEQRASQQQTFVQIAEFAQILKQRWHLEGLGPRTEELLRNSLCILADNQLTLLELGPLLTNAAFRSACLNRAKNGEVKAYFATRYDAASESMQAVLRDAILNKVSAFTADPHFRHILGQRHSTFSLTTAIDEGYWILVNLDKGRLGEQASTLGSLLLARLRGALFARRYRELRVLYCDEVQNLILFDSGLDTLLSEARKYGASVVTANQFLDQYPQVMRSAILAVGTHAFFQLSSSDAEKIAAALGGGRTLSEILKNLPQRQMIVKSGHHIWRRVAVPTVHQPSIDSSDLYERCRERWARRREDVEAEISTRQAAASRSSNQLLDDWE